ncbi:MAG: FAD-dependent oxidoreductase [Robiginitomaculum sp.]|nr:FAD-dependent oxidoreductase [Robiginitomaculum sp.]
MKPDFQIIGGGLIGLSTAYALIKRGASVRIIEAREGVALETSFANAGMVHASLADPWNGPGVGRQLLGSIFGLPSPIILRLQALPSVTTWGLKFLKHASPARHWHATKANYQLANYSVNLIQNWREELNMEDDYQGSGLLKIFRDAPTFEKASTLTNKLQGLGLKAEFITGVQAAVTEPCLEPITDKLVGAIYYPDDHKADAYAFCQGLATEIKRLGGEILTGVFVKALLSERGKVIGAGADAGDLYAHTTIIAAGAHSAHVLRPQGVKLALRPVKGYSLTFEDILDENQTVPKLPVVDDELHCAVTPLGKSIRIAGTAEIAGYNRAMPNARLRPLFEMLRAVYPELSQNISLQDGIAWHGFRPVSADGMPFIGHVKPGLAINTGHGHMGWTMSAGSGELLANLLLGTPTGLDASAFNPSRN